jgi:hypothetical protein
METIPGNPLSKILKLLIDKTANCINKKKDLRFLEGLSYYFKRLIIS